MNPVRSIPLPFALQLEHLKKNAPKMSPEERAKLIASIDRVLAIITKKDTK